MCILRLCTGLHKSTRIHIKRYINRYAKLRQNLYWNLQPITSIRKAVEDDLQFYRHTYSRRGINWMCIAKDLLEIQWYTIQGISRLMISTLYATTYHAQFKYQIKSIINVFTLRQMEHLDTNTQYLTEIFYTVYKLSSHLNIPKRIC